MGCETYRLEEVCSFIDYRGKTPPKTTSGIPLITAKIIKNGYIQTPQEFIAPEFYDEWMRRGIPQKGAVIFTTEAPLGEVAQIKTSNRLAFAQRVIIMEAKKDILDAGYLFYALQDKLLKGRIEARATGTTVVGIKSSELKKVEIDIPRLLTQQKIAKILSSLDDKIELNNRMNENLEGQLDLLFANLCYRKEWGIEAIGNAAAKIGMGPFGSNIKVASFVDEGVPIISGNHLRAKFLEEPSFNYITEDHAQKLKNSLVYPKDIIFTHAGNIGQVAMIPSDCNYDYYVLSQRQFYMRCDTTKVLPEYVILFFHSKNGKHELLSYANQTGVPSLAQPATNLKKILIPLPPIQEQIKWSNTICPIIDMYRKNYLENIRLAQLRDTLLPRLMSGEIDVDGVEV